MAHRTLITQDIVETITPQIIKGTMETPMQADPSTKEETHNITPQMHLIAGTIIQSQWT
jgi:hypothetical protein